jgi:hypothetical protein
VGEEQPQYDITPSYIAICTEISIMILGSIEFSLVGEGHRIGL